MFAFLETIGIAVVMFAATNADDLVLLTVFFSQPGSSTRQIALGQLAGIGALTAISYIAAMLALAVPHGWLPWLGFIPLAIGLQWLRRPAHANNEKPPIVTRWWTVAGVTIANGADNLGVYIPQFAVQSGGEKVITIVSFFFLSLLWCSLAWLAVRNPALSPVISKLCRRSAPWILIGLGFWIIAQYPAIAALFHGSS